MSDDVDRLPCSDVVCGLGGHHLCTGRYRTPEEQTAIRPRRTSLHNQPMSDQAARDVRDAFLGEDLDHEEGAR